MFLLLPVLLWVISESSWLILFVHVCTSQWNGEWCHAYKPPNRGMNLRVISSFACMRNTCTYMKWVHTVLKVWFSAGKISPDFSEMSENHSKRQRLSLCLPKFPRFAATFFNWQTDPAGMTIRCLPSTWGVDLQSDWHDEEFVTMAIRKKHIMDM